MFLVLNSCPFCSYESPDIALNCGIMLRECIRHEPLAKITLCSEQFYDFFRYVEMSTFDIASDAFATFKVSVFVNVEALGVCFVWVASLIVLSSDALFNYYVWFHLFGFLPGFADETQTAQRWVSGAALWQSESQAFLSLSVVLRSVIHSAAGSSQNCLHLMWKSIQLEVIWILSEPLMSFRHFKSVLID